MITDLKRLRKIAAFVRVSALEDAVRAQKGHLGGTFSCVELLVSLYYGGFLDVDRIRSRSKERDFFFMGKGHACLALYPILKDLGFISEDRYYEYGKDGSSLGGQLDTSILGAENNTGSLGHALGLACGVALSAKLDGRTQKAVALLGDAECEEGSIWEAIFFAAEHELKNVTCIVDRNRLSVTRVMENSVVFDQFVEKMSLFGWNCVEIDGHDFGEIGDALDVSEKSDQPTIILANTIKGKGISFMEDVTKWHHTMPSEKEVEIARAELGIHDL